MNQSFTYTTTNMCLSFAETFTFSAKEKDAETGYSYFGARYYNSELSIWLSVDPMSDKYPSLSPYVYCANNPVKLVDPNGEEIGDYFNQNGTYLGTDCVDDGKIHIIHDEVWEFLKGKISWEGNDGENIIQKDLGNLFSKTPTESNLSDEAIVSIFEHYNESTYSCAAMKRGSSINLDNGVSSGLTTDHSTKNILVRIDGNTNSKIINNYNEIINLLIHEKQHVDDRLNKYSGDDYQCEKRALNRQVNHPTFVKTRESFQNATYDYALKYGIKFQNR